MLQFAPNHHQLLWRQRPDFVQNGLGLIAHWLNYIATSKNDKASIHILPRPPATDSKMTWQQGEFAAYGILSENAFAHYEYFGSLVA
jgi:hypothetical protein